jgi:hypothetical protein
MNTLTFLNAPLLWGLGLASIPILIHLLFRRQYRRIDWAPMHYLKLSIQRNRRRIRLEQILLLLLRTVLVMLLFFLLARPVMHAEGLSRWLGGSGRTNRIVVLDDSLSMGYSEAGKTALGRGQDVLVDLLPTFGAKDRLTLVLASRPKQPLAREIDLDNVDDIVRDIRDVKPTEVFGAWEPILQAVDELIAGGSYPLHEVTLVTDLRETGWEGQLAELGSRWAGQRVRLRVFDVGVADTSNIALVSLEQADRLALVAAPTRFEAQVRNDTPGEMAGLEANFIVDGKASLVRVPTLAAGETVKLPLVAVFQEAGPHDVAFELSNDALPGDNARWAVVHVQQSIDLLLVDGEPSTEALGGETDFLALALSLSGDASEAFHVEVMTDSEWASTSPTHPDLLVLANLARLSSDQAELVEREVAAGMGLMIFVGDQLDPDNYNQLLYKGGSGLLPAEFEGIADSEFSGLLVETAEGSPLEALGQLTPAALERIKVRKSYEVRRPPGDVEGVRVLARWNNQAAAPAVLEKIFGQGRVLLWTTAADRSWSDWPTDSSYVLSMREAARAIAKSTASLHQFTAGQALRVDLSASRDITLPAIEVPGGKEPKPLVLGGAASGISDEAKQAKSGRALRFGDTRRAGLYKMTWRDSVSGARSESFAVNPDRRESDLARINTSDFEQMWGALEPEVISISSGSDSALAVRGQEVWRTLATGLLGLLVVEACFARWAGRQR